LGRRALDYLLAIYILSRDRGYARLTDISRYMGVSPPSAHEYISELIKIGYATGFPPGLGSGWGRPFWSSPRSAPSATASPSLT
jgi:hypothetical protein